MNKKNSEEIYVSAEEETNTSFVPVREKSKKLKSEGKSEKYGEKVLNTYSVNDIKKSKETLATTDQYKTKKSTKHQAVRESLPVVTRKFSDTFEKIQNFVVVNTLEEKPGIEYETVLKESKKVSSLISYASVVSNSYHNTDDETKVKSFEVVNNPDSLENNLKQSPISLESSKSSSESIETLDSYDIQESSIKYKSYEDASIIPLSKQYISNSSSEEVVPNLVLLDSSKSSSDSIETLEYSSNDFQEGLNKFERPLELSATGNLPIEQSTNSLFFLSSKSTSDSIETLEHCDIQESIIKFETPLEVTNTVTESKETYLGSSSGCVIDYQEEFEKEEQKIVEDLLGPDLVRNNLSQNSIDETLILSDFVGKSPGIESFIENITECSLDFDLEKIHLLEGELTEPSQDNTNLLNIVHNQELIEQNFEELFIDQEILTESSQVNTKFSEQNFEQFPVGQELQVNFSANSKEIFDLNDHSSQVVIEEKSANCECIKEQEVSKLNLEQMKQIRVLTLNDKEHQQCTLYRLEKNWILQFRIGPSLFGRKVFLYCNYPMVRNNFNRNKHYLLSWELDEGCKNADDTAAFVNVTVEIAGSFHYFFTFTEG